MSINSFIAALEEYLELKKAAKTGSETDLSDEVAQIKKRLALSLKEIVDHRLDGVIELRKRRASSTIKNITIPDPDVEWADVSAVIEALNCPPKPIVGKALEDMKPAQLKNWMDCYNSWYSTKRSNALNNPVEQFKPSGLYSYGRDIKNKKI